MVEVITLDDLIRELYQVFQIDSVNVDYVHHIMCAYKSNPKDWQKFAKFDRFRYTRNLVDSGNGKFNLMILCWSEGLSSTIHDHSNSHCFMKVLYGQIQETRFCWPESINQENMKQKDNSMYKINEVTYINDELGLHRITNPSHTDVAVTLHLYVPPFDKCTIFDEHTGRRNVSPVTFYSTRGKEK